MTKVSRFTRRTLAAFVLASLSPGLAGGGGPPQTGKVEYQPLEQWSFFGDCVGA